MPLSILYIIVMVEILILSIIILFVIIVRFSYRRVNEKKMLNKSEEMYFNYKLEKLIRNEYI